MRTLFLALLLLFSGNAFANMANPIREGILGARPFASSYIDILHEDLKITLQRENREAAYEVVYQIRVLKDSMQIPFLFVAMEYAEGFRVELDGQEVEVLELPEDLKGSDSLALSDFDSLFGGREVNIANGERWPQFVRWEGMKYFQADLSKGEHVIKVWYKGVAWEDRWGWAKEYSFRYALSPANYWKSFGDLSLTVDARDWASSTLGSNLGKPDGGSLESIARWEFTELPLDVILLNDQFEIPALAQILTNNYPVLLTLVAILLLGIHVWAIWKYRRKRPRFSFSWVVLLGGVLVPIGLVLAWWGSFELIDRLLGDEATGTNGYGLAMAILSLPMWIAMYAVLMFLVDAILTFFLKKKQA